LSLPCEWFDCPFFRQSGESRLHHGVFHFLFGQ
jgi:hypothetical protein